ncbi:MAG: hypothetical protein DRP02_02105 [Candidatus Gerdarchaeota archaeon]|nr:MAG: hypothetical protein DRO63_01855 [Candidatus Gerdarchaeota archaeon]RLI72330.1 MAG: hypothetical protein DRP02_02105 [Candidatus Gerdarchaeota archaeon]
MGKNKVNQLDAKKLLKENLLVLPVVAEMLEAKTNLGKGEIETPKEIKEIDALIFSRGRLNAQFFRGNRSLFVVPSWVERMLHPKSKGVVSLGHCASFINTNYRNWVAFGGVNCHSEGIVTDRGLVVPLNNGYGILTGLFDGEKVYFSSSDGKNVQTLLEGHLPIIVNEWELDGEKIYQTVYAGKQLEKEIGVLQFRKNKKNKGKLLVSLRPFNQEGVFLIHSINYSPKNRLITINNKFFLQLQQTPEKIFIGNYHSFGDSARNVIKEGFVSKNGTEIKTECSVGLANMTFLFPENEEHIEVVFSMTDNSLGNEHLAIDTVTTEWKNILAEGLQLSTGNKEMDRLYLASLANLLLLTDPGTITPGPTEYHRFWCRDAAFLINALDKSGYHNYAREVLAQFIKRQRPDGFYYSHEGEFDSPGEGIWAFTEHYKLTRDIAWLETVFPSIEKAAKWIISTRRHEQKKMSLERNEQLTKGLLPPGYSAEHLGPCDYFYWDNFWGVAGVRDAAYCAKVLEHNSATFLQKEYQDYLFDLLASTTRLFQKFGFLPVGPFRKGDSAMIANLVVFHPIKIWDGKNEILRKTAEEIYRTYTYNGGFFHEVAWNCYGTYLTMHLAEVFHGLHDSAKVRELLKWLIKHQTCPMGWAEGISPQTMQGGMGDSPHGWASAEWILLLRNLFCSETLDGSIKLLSGFPVENLRKGIEAKSLQTYYGKVNFKARLTKKKLSVKLLQNISISSLKIMTPALVSKIITDKGDAFKIGEQTVEISTKAKKVIIEFE